MPELKNGSMHQHVCMHVRVSKRVYSYVCTYVWAHQHVCFVTLTRAFVLQLQKKILQRDRELGMVPVLPAFSGIDYLASSVTRVYVVNANARMYAKRRILNVMVQVLTPFASAYRTYVSPGS